MHVEVRGTGNGCSRNQTAGGQRRLERQRSARIMSFGSRVGEGKEHPSCQSREKHYSRESRGPKSILQPIMRGDTSAVVPRISPCVSEVPPWTTGERRVARAGRSYVTTGAELPRKTAERPGLFGRRRRQGNCRQGDRNIVQLVQGAVLVVSGGIKNALYRVRIDFGLKSLRDDGNIPG